MFSQLHPPFPEPSSSIPFHYSSLSSSGNTSRVQQIPHHQNSVTAEGNITGNIAGNILKAYLHMSVAHFFVFTFINCSCQYLWGFLTTDLGEKHSDLRTGERKADAKCC